MKDLSVAGELDRLLSFLNVPFTFDRNRDVTKPCVFCRSKLVRLVELGRYQNGTDFTRPVCDPCAKEVSGWSR